MNSCWAILESSFNFSDCEVVKHRVRVFQAISHGLAGLDKIKERRHGPHPLILEEQKYSVNHLDKKAAWDYVLRKVRLSDRRGMIKHPLKDVIRNGS